MATTIHGFPIPVAVRANPAARESFGSGKRQSKRALRILAHAIEYVANEFLHEPTPPGPRNARLQAVKLLMAADRQVHSERPDAPSLAQHWRWIQRARGALATPSAPVSPASRKC
jgi:hypothetical protein